MSKMTKNLLIFGLGILAAVIAIPGVRAGLSDFWNSAQAGITGPEWVTEDGIVNVEATLDRATAFAAAMEDGDHAALKAYGTSSGVADAQFILNKFAAANGTFTVSSVKPLGACNESACVFVARVEYASPRERLRVYFRMAVNEEGNVTSVTLSQSVPRS